MSKESNTVQRGSKMVNEEVVINGVKTDANIPDTLIKELEQEE